MGLSLGVSASVVDCLSFSERQSTVPVPVPNLNPTDMFKIQNKFSERLGTDNLVPYRHQVKLVMLTLKKTSGHQQLIQVRSIKINKLCQRNLVRRKLCSGQ